MTDFLGASEQYCIGVTVDGKRKVELGLIVPGRYKAMSKRRKYVNLLWKEIGDKVDTLIFI